MMARGDQAVLAGIPRHAVGCTIRTVYLDEHGAPQTAVHQMTQAVGEMTRRGGEIRAAAECYYTMLGYELVSVQLVLEHVTCVEEAVERLEPKKNHLRLVASGGKRVLSDEARHLAESAGLDPASMFGSTAD